MTTKNDKNNWNDRLKTADNAYVSELLHNFGLSGGLSLKDLPYIPLTGFGAALLHPKFKQLKQRMQERKQQRGLDDNRNVNNFSDDMSKMRDIVNQRKPVRNHPSVPGFTPDTRAPHGIVDHTNGIFDQDTGGYVGGPYEEDNNIVDIREHPRFNSADQGKSQRGRPFDRDEE